MDLSKNLVIVLVIVFIGGIGTAYAGIVLPTITLGGNVEVDGSLNVDGPITGQTITNLENKIDSICGSNSIGGNEECDGSDLDGETCVSKGLDGGTLQCNASCEFDFSLCFVS